METRQLGRTGLQVSALGFGGAPAGLSGYIGPWDATDDASQANVEGAIRRALARGITYFDTAPGYGQGIAESVFGRALAGDRHQIILATKTPADRWEPAAIRAELEASLRRLQTDYVDLLQFHGGWYTEAGADQILDRGGLETYERLRQEGKVRFIGFTAEGPNSAVERLIASGRFDTLMICFNLIYQTAGGFRNRTLPPETILSQARSHQMGVLTMRTLTSGVFQRWVAQVAPTAAGIDWNGALLGYVLSHPQVDVALVGMRQAGEVDQNADLVESGVFRLDLPALHDGYSSR